MDTEFRRWMKWYGKEYGDYQLVKGDFLLDSLRDTISQSTYVRYIIFRGVAICLQLAPTMREFVQQSSCTCDFCSIFRILFVNNFAFGPAVDHQVTLGICRCFRMVIQFLCLLRGTALLFSSAFSSNYDSPIYAKVPKSCRPKPFVH